MPPAPAAMMANARRMRFMVKTLQRDIETETNHVPAAPRTAEYDPVDQHLLEPQGDPGWSSACAEVDRANPPAARSAMAARTRFMEVLRNETKGSEKSIIRRRAFSTPASG